MDENIQEDSRMCAVLMCRCCARLCRVMNGILAKTGVNMAQCQVLATLEEKGEITMGELSSALGVTMGAGTNVVDKLVDAGYVDRARSSTDRRVVKVALTQDGADAHGRTGIDLSEFWSGALDQVEPEERKAFFDSYDKVLRLAEGAAAG